MLNNTINKPRARRGESLTAFEIPENEPFKPLFEKFAQFRKELKKPFKTQQGVNGWFKRLKQLSTGSYETANAIVEQSIANEWQGIFPLRQQDRQNIQPNRKMSEEDEKRMCLGLEYVDKQGNKREAILHRGSQDYEEAEAKFKEWQTLRERKEFE